MTYQATMEKIFEQLRLDGFLVYPLKSGIWILPDYHSIV